MKILLFDLLVTQPNGSSKFHGGGEYVKTLFRKILNYSNEIKIKTFYDFDSFIDDSIKNQIEKFQIEAFDIKTYKDLERCGLLEKSDIYLCGLSEPIIDLNIPKNVTVVTIYHGIRALEKPIDRTSYLYNDNFVKSAKDVIRFLLGKVYLNYEKSKVNKAFEKSDYLVGVSNSAVSSVRVFFPEIDSEKLLLAYAPLKVLDSEIEKKPSDGSILMLGGDRWVKNVYRGILALDGLFNNKQLAGYHVNIVGKVSNKIKRKIKNKDRFVFLDYVDPLDLEELFSKCELLFYPTLNEGFGYPPLEAMKYGKTCLVSSVSSLPEIYKSSVYYCNPYDIEEMKARLLFASEHRFEEQFIVDTYKSIAKRSDESIEKLCKFVVGL